MRAKQRVRLHLKDDLPSVEGLLMRKRGSEFVVARTSLITAPHANPAELASRELVIPRENVAFYEVL